MSLNLNNISLTGNGRKGEPYTQAEKDLALHILHQITGLTGREVDLDVVIPEEVQVAVSEAIDESQSHTVKGLARAAFGKVIDAHFEEGKPLHADKFPKQRDWTSIGLLFRQAASHKSLMKAYSQNDIDAMFPAYWKKKKSA